MFSHVTIGTGNLERARGFYDAVLAPLGIQRVFNLENGSGWRREGEEGAFWVGPPFNGAPAVAGNGWMAAFTAPTRAAVDAAHASALAGGGTCEGPPGLRPHYAADYYGAYARDPEGNKIHFVCRGD